MAVTIFEKPMGSEVETLKGQIGTLSNLTTAAKGSAVGAINELNGKIRTIHPTTELGTMSDLVSLINESASGVFVNCRIGATIVNKLCGVSARQGIINAFKSNASSDYIEYTVIDTEAVVYSGYYKISTDTATYDQLALNSKIIPSFVYPSNSGENNVINIDMTAYANGLYMIVGFATVMFVRKQSDTTLTKLTPVIYISNFPDSSTISGLTISNFYVGQWYAYPKLYRIMGQ